MNWTDKIQVYNEDCMETMARYEDGWFDLAIVDPPYGIETKGNAQDRFRMGKSLDLINDAKPNKKYFNELFRVSKNQIIWGYNHLSDLLPSCREFIFWYKNQPVPTFSDGELAWTSFTKTAKCFNYSIHKSNASNKGNKIHPTQKPVALYNWILDRYAKPDFKIIDTHLGSGSNAISCHHYGCELVAAELDTDYYNDSHKRFKLNTAQQKLFT